MSTPAAELSFLRSVLSEPDGSGSAARVLTSLVVIAALVWISFLVFTHKSFPDFVGVTTWVVTVASSLYGVNKVSTAFGKSS